MDHEPGKLPWVAPLVVPLNTAANAKGGGSPGPIETTPALPFS